MALLHFPLDPLELFRLHEPLLEVSTDKVDTEIPSPAAGVLASIKVAEDETVEVGAELAVIDAPSHLHLAYRAGVPIVRALDL